MLFFAEGSATLFNLFQPGPRPETRQGKPRIILEYLL